MSLHFLFFIFTKLWRKKRRKLDMLHHVLHIFGRSEAGYIHKRKPCIVGVEHISQDGVLLTPLPSFLSHIQASNTDHFFKLFSTALTSSMINQVSHSWKILFPLCVTRGQFLMSPPLQSSIIWLISCIYNLVVILIILS